MLKVPTQTYSERDKVALLQFLQKCKETAATKYHFQIANISLEIKHIDPLAVLQSIYEPHELHFYLEHPVSKEAVAGAEAVVSGTFSGPNRFKEAKSFAEKQVRNTIATGDLNSSMGELRFFCSFTFFDEVGSEALLFPAATIFIPRWQVSCRNGKYTAVANIKVEANSNIYSLAEKIWSAHQKFLIFDYQKKLPISNTNKEIQLIEEVGGKTWYENAVRLAVSKIKQNAYKKIVLARAVDLKAENSFNPLESLNKIRNQYTDCFPCSVANGKGQSFIAIAPERLLKVTSGQVQTEAVAGTTARGKTAQEDVYLANQLLNSEKDLIEHQIVIDTIVEHLWSLNISPQVSSPPKIKKLANVQHLYSAIVGKIEKQTHLLDIISGFHPTPAVGGFPTKQAQQGIREIENFERGLYAGTVGWFNHKGEGEFIVAIRSALIDGNKARVYAGGGIIETSDPESEHKETDLKIKAVLNNLR